MKELQQLNKYFKKYKYHFFGGIAITIVAQIFALFTPKLINKSISTIANFNTDYTDAELSEAKYIIIESIVLILITTLVYSLLTFLMRQTLIVMSRHIEFELKNDVYAHYQKLSLSFYKQNKVGDLMNRISEDVSKVRMYVGPAVMYSINTIIRFSVVIIYMWVASPKLTLYTLLPLPILSYAIYKISKEINTRSTIFQENLSHLSSYVQEFFSGIRVVKAFSLEQQKEQVFSNISLESKDKNLALAKINAFFGPLMIMLIGLSNLVVIFIGGMMYLSGEISELGVIAEFILYVNMLTWPVASIGWVSSLVQEAEASQKRLNEFLNLEPQIVDNNPKDIKTLEGNIVFKQVSLVYPDTNLSGLNDVTFSIKAKQTIGIIGKTGSGKTSLLHLLNRVYDTTAGQILIDGHPIAEIPLKTLRENIAVVPQDGFLFSMSILDNIKFGNLHSSLDEVKNACKLAHVDHNIMELKDQYNTLLGERGINLSGGQKQRISIARALIKNSPILLFDDCLSAVDTETEQIILENLKQMSQDKTTIIVSNRVSSVKDADFIIVLDEGKIVQQGKHEELIKQEGLYEVMYEKQLYEAAV